MCSCVWRVVSDGPSALFALSEEKVQRLRDQQRERDAADARQIAAANKLSVKLFLDVRCYKGHPMSPYTGSWPPNYTTGTPLTSQTRHFSICVYIPTACVV